MEGERYKFKVSGLKLEGKIKEQNTSRCEMCEITRIETNNANKLSLCRHVFSD